MPGSLGPADGGRSSQPKSARIIAVSEGLRRTTGSEPLYCSVNAVGTEIMVDSRWAV